MAKAISEMTAKELAEALAQAQAENTALKQAQRRAATRGLTAKVALDKDTGKPKTGALSVYGLGRFPVTLYSGQWLRLKEWITEGSLDDALILYADILATKGEDQAG